MQSCVIQEFPYRHDSSALFATLRQRVWPAFLDSGRPFSVQGRYDILAADPSTRLVTRGLATVIESSQGRRVSPDDPLTLLRDALGPIRRNRTGLPFCGGALGYFGYDLAGRWDAPRHPADALAGVPDMAVGIYDWALVVDHVARRSRLIAPDRASLTEYAGLLAKAGDESTKTPEPHRYQVLERVRSQPNRARYLEAVAQIKQYLYAGDCYQVNFARRFSAPARGDPWTAYRQLRTQNPAPFGAYLATPDWQVLCASPERFLRVRDGLVETRPIKGTRPRSRDPDTDRRLAQALHASAKDRAENVMIVDLLRNDLGRVCAVGSIQTPQLFAIESYARVHHLVSTVTGRLAAGRTALDLLRAGFPGGSVTGAPKRRAMEIIAELEPWRRGIYCGAIGYLGFDGAMDTNIAIRTLVHTASCAQLWAGGGIVADSDPESEYRETGHKAAAFLELLAALRRPAP